MQFEAGALEVLHEVGRAVVRASLHERLADRQAEDGDAAVRVPILLDRATQAVPRAVEPDAVRPAAAGGNRLERLLVQPSYRQLAGERAEFDGVRRARELIVILEAGALEVLHRPH